MSIQKLAPAAMWFALILLLLAGAIYWAQRIRRGDSRLAELLGGGSIDATDDAHAMLARFRELHARGGLSDEEFRTIKQKLAPRLGIELEGAPATEGGEAT